jgi:hypothetical protein
MKIAELLLHRAAARRKLDSLRTRIDKNARVQEDTVAHEEAAHLLEAALAANDELARAILAIHEANLRGRLADGRSLTAAIAERDRLKGEHSLLMAAVTSATTVNDRYSGREIRWVSTLDVAEIQRRADDCAMRLRDLNVELQRANWAVEVESPG